MFRDILTVCYIEGLIGKSMFAVDGCKIASNCAKEWSGTKTELKKKAEKIEASLRLLNERHRSCDSQSLELGQKEKKQRAIEHLQAKAAKIRSWLQDNPERFGIRGKPVKSNLIEPDSAKMVSSHGVIQGCTGVAVVDDSHQVVLEAEAFGDGHEAPHLQEVLDSVQETFFAIDASPEVLKQAALTADSGFHREQTVKMLLERSVDAYVADNRFRLRDPRFASLQEHRAKTTDSKHTSKARKYFSPADFLLDESGALRCPAGHPMKCSFNTYRSNNGFHGRLYEADSIHCSPRPLRSRCMRMPHTPARQVVKLEKGIRHDRESFTQRMIERFDSSRGRYFCNRRMGTVEPVFANIRSTIGLNRFSLRGRRKVDAQWKLFCVVHNIGKLV